MFTATEFTYDGTHSGTYGLKIAGFNSDVMEEAQYVVPTINTAKSAKSQRFFYLDATLDSPPTYDFSVVSETAIHETTLRDILKWLDCKKGFRELVIMQPDYAGITYRCVFTVTSLIYHRGNCIGLNLTATFDSPYQYGTPIKVNLSGDGAVKEIVIYNDSDNVGEYTYPNIEFKSSDGKISIINMSDDETREFKFEGLAANTTYKVDNELKIITGEGGDLLSKFSKKWLRLRRGANKLKVTINGTAVINCPQYIKIAF